METSLLYPVTNDQRTDQKLDGLWQFKFDEAGEGEKSGWETGFHDGVSMPVPASFNDFFTDKASREYTGDFWYSRNFFVPSAAKGKALFLRFDAVTHRATIFVNGKEIRMKAAFYHLLPISARPLSMVPKIPWLSKVITNCRGKHCRPGIRLHCGMVRKWYVRSLTSIITLA